MSDDLTLERLTADALAVLTDYQQDDIDGLVPEWVLKEIAFTVLPLFTVAEVYELVEANPELPSPEDTPLATIISEVHAQIQDALRLAMTTSVPIRIKVRPVLPICLRTCGLRALK